MNLTYKYWFFKSVLDNKFCDDVIKYASSKKENLATTFGSDVLPKKDIKKLKKIRDSNIVWLNEQWIYNKIQPYVHMANKNAGWNFSWDWSENIQFTKYKLNQHYTWHNDMSPVQTTDNPNTNGKYRKLSVVCSLSDPKDFKGGKLQFRFDDEKIIKRSCKEILPRGSIVVFPSFIYHRVTPVTQGTRYSLVMWNLGYPFK